MLDFAVIIHPVNLDLIYIFDPGTKEKRPPLLRKVLEWTPSFYTCEIEGTTSITGKQVHGCFIMCPLLPDQILNSRPEFVLKRVIAAGRIAEKLGAKILGLAAYTSLVGRKGSLIARALKIPVTTGTSYTISIAINGILKAADMIGLNLKNAKVTIIGATGTIGTICSQVLAGLVSSMVLVARNKQRLSDLAYLIQKQNTYLEIKISDDIGESIKETDIILLSTNSPGDLIDVTLLQPGTLICDISQPKNISEKSATLRNDILIIDGGVVKPYGEPNFNFNFGLSPGLAFACIAETMILALEERYENYSIGGQITLNKVKEISRLAEKHGFKLAGLRGFDKEITKEQIKNMKNEILKR